jgi:ribosomal protein L11 methyltransferase
VGEGHGFGLIVAHIRASALEDFIQSGISRDLADGGRIVMSGILEEQLDSIIENAESGGLQTEQVMQTGDWRSVIFSKAKNLPVFS